MAYKTVTIQLHVEDATVEAIEARLQIIAALENLQIDAFDMYLETKVAEFCKDLQGDIEDLVKEIAIESNLDDLIVKAIQENI